MARALSSDVDGTLAALALASRAADETLARSARAVASRLALQLAAAGTEHRPRRGRSSPRARPSEDELDLDLSLDAVLQARAERRSPAPEELKGILPSRPSLALSLVVDRSGSMSGRQLATAAVAAAAVALHAPDDVSVLVFAEAVWVLASQGAHWPDLLVADLVSLVGSGPTDLARGLSAAHDELARSDADRKVTVLLSDCRVTAGADPVPAAAGLAELAILAPAGDLTEAESLAQRSGARLVALEGPRHLPDALAAVLC